MGERNPIFGKGRTQIGYVEGGEAFDLSGRKRCNYSKETGNLFDDSRQTVGHVSLAGKFVGVASLADKLFPKFDNAQTELRGISGTPNQPLSESDDVTTIRISLEEFSASGPTEPFQSKAENKERVADAESRSVGGSPSQPLSETSQVTTLTEPAEQPSADPTEAVQLKGENEQRAVDAEHRHISEAPSQPLSEEAAEPPSADPTEAIQSKNENEQRAVDAERRGIGGTSGQPLSEASQVMTLAESADQPIAPDPTEVIQLENENEQRAVDAERRDVSETLSQSLSEASQVTTPAESAEQPIAPDPTEVIQLEDENEERAGDAERRRGTLNQSLSEASQETTCTESAEQLSAPDQTEAIQPSDAEPRGISETPGQPLPEPSEATTRIDGEPNTAGPTEPLHSNDAKKNRVVRILKALERAAHAKRHGVGGTSGQTVSRPSEVSTLTASLHEPSTPDPTEPSHSKDADKDRLVEILKASKRAADAKRRGIGGAPSQPLSAPTKVRTPTEAPDEPSTADSAEAFFSNDADKDRLVKVLKALMKRSQGR